VRIVEVALSHFRNHSSTRIELGNGLNALVGNNGQGKTNILEAIAYLSFTKSFYAAADTDALQFGHEFFEIDGSIETDSNSCSGVAVRFQKDPLEKRITVNQHQVARHADVVGEFPAVVLSPEHGSIIAGGPAERRKFLDLVLSQTSRAYLEDVIEYRRVVRQRNKILADGRHQQVSVSLIIEPWTESLILHGARIMERRQRFLASLGPYVVESYQTISGGEHDIGVHYVPGGSLEAEQSEGDFRAWMSEQIRVRHAEEIKRGASLVGPHRDDVRFTISRLSAQQFASQGEQKSLLIALKMAEYEYIRERRNEWPLLLLDDVFSELDQERTERVLQRIGAKGQCVITATDVNVFRHVFDECEQHRRFTVENGTCRPS
jgi:DNA replication and repair protein RecF